MRKITSARSATSTFALIGATSLVMSSAGLTGNAEAQESVRLDELSVAGPSGGTGRAGQGVGLLKDLPAPYAGGQFARGGGGRHRQRSRCAAMRPTYQLQNFSTSISVCGE